MFTDELKANHQTKMIVLEHKKESERKEREKVFSEKFSEDIKNYKEQGQIKSKSVINEMYIMNSLKCCDSERLITNCYAIRSWDKIGRWCLL